MRLWTLLLLASLTGFAAEHRRPRMPLLFIPNHGQASPEAQFMVKGLGVTALFERDEVVYTAHGGSVRVRFTGATGPTAVEGVARIAGEVNFLSGREEDWQRGIPVYSGVAYRDVYTGIDLTFSGTGRHLKSEFLVAPGADPARIGLEFTGADRVWVQDDGSLGVRFGRRLVHEEPPLIYQVRNGEKLHVDGSFVVTGDVVTFSIGAYDRTLQLVIDPVVYTTPLSGSGADAALSLAVDNTGAAYIAGFTSSFDLATINPAQGFHAGGNEVFVAKLNPAGNALVYCTFIGGRGDDRAAAIAVDSAGAAYVAGATTSSNFPVRAALQPTFGGVKDAFVLKLNGTGNALVYSTYLGGAASDSANGVALDSAGNVYVAGDTASTGFPASGFQTTLRGGVDAFVAKIAADGSRRRVQHVSGRLGRRACGRGRGGRLRSGIRGGFDVLGQLSDRQRAPGNAGGRTGSVSDKARRERRVAGVQHVPGRERRVRGISRGGSVRCARSSRKRLHRGANKLGKFSRAQPGTSNQRWLAGRICRKVHQRRSAGLQHLRRRTERRRGGHAGRGCVRERAHGRGDDLDSFDVATRGAEPGDWPVRRLHREAHAGGECGERAGVAWRRRFGQYCGAGVGCGGRRVRRRIHAIAHISPAERDSGDQCRKLRRVHCQDDLVWNGGRSDGESSFGDVACWSDTTIHGGSGKYGKYGGDVVGDAGSGNDLGNGVVYGAGDGREYADSHGAGDERGGPDEVGAGDGDSERRTGRDQPRAGKGRHPEQHLYASGEGHRRQHRRRLLPRLRRPHCRGAVRLVGGRSRLLGHH